jgi:hypothetical protein
MKKILSLMFGLVVVLYLGGTSFAQGKGGGRGPGGPPENHSVDHKDADHDNAHAKGEAHQEGHKDTNFESRIDKNPALKAKVDSMLPAGMDLKTAAAGFRNEGQFLATLHVSKNLNIPFDQLKAKMTGSNPMTLGQSIHALKPNMSEKDAEKEVDKAEKEAKADERTKSAPKPVT